MESWIQESLDKDDIAFYTSICDLMNTNHYEKAYSKLNQFDFNSLNLTTRRGALFLSELAGLLIDLGAEGIIRDAVEQGLELLESNSTNLLKYTSKGSFEYNLGNAKKSLFEVIRHSNIKFNFTPESIDLLNAAKNHYWRAFKLIPEGNREIRKEIMVNLGNTLSENGRSLEAIYYLDRVLKLAPNFPRGNASRGVAL